MAEYITDLKVSLNKNDESELREQCYKKLPGNLNEGTKGYRIYLWYKKGQEHAITRIQFSFNDKMANGLSDAGYCKLDKNLNKGTDGDTIYLWYFRGSSESDIPITDLAVATNVEAEAAKYRAGWQRAACDLNRYAGGNRVYLFVKRATPVYISAITASGNFEEDVDKFQKGYIRVDENTNRGAGGRYTFIWYLLTTDKEQALHGPLEISINDQQYNNYQSQGYKPVNQDLNEGTGGNPVYLWYKKDGPEGPIRDVSVIRRVAVTPFVKDGINVIDKNLNECNCGLHEFLCYAEFTSCSGTQAEFAPAELSH